MSCLGLGLGLGLGMRLRLRLHLSLCLGLRLHLSLCLRLRLRPAPPRQSSLKGLRRPKLLLHCGSVRLLLLLLHRLLPRTTGTP